MKHFIPGLGFAIFFFSIVALILHADRVDQERMASLQPPPSTFWRVKYEPTTQEEREKVQELVVKMSQARSGGLFGDSIEDITKEAKKIVCEPTEWEMTVNGHDETGRVRKLVKQD